MNRNLQSLFLDRLPNLASRSDVDKASSQEPEEVGPTPVENPVERVGGFRCDPCDVLWRGVLLSPEEIICFVCEEPGQRIQAMPYIDR